jgi:pilus assembly protein CpaC
MYDNHHGVTASAYRKLRRSHLPAICACLITTVLAVANSAVVQAQELQSASVIRKIGGTNEKLELTTNTSRILTLDKNIPRVQVNNPDLLAVTPLSATQVQISAKKAGVTQVNLWDDEGKVHAVDVQIYGDARELEIALQTQFPHASIKVFRYSESLVLTGYVDRPDHVSPIMQLAADYSPKVINNISVGGVQQVLLKVKVMEISRTKLRRLGVDWAVRDGSGGFALNSVNGILGFDGIGSLITNNGDTFSFGVVHGNSQFFGFLDALQQNHVAKILSEPDIMAVSGRPAQFNVGGEIPIVVPQSLGTSSIEYKPFGTQIDFLPIVLGNGNIRLEVRPRISEIDDSRSVIVQNFTIPALTVRQVDTAVEMKAGQTFALAGLVQERTEVQKRGLPYVADMPIIGVPFRKTEDVTNEIELLILVTPEFVDPIDACEAPCGGPGMSTTSPNNRGLYCGGYMEVPTACNPTNGLGSCGQVPCGHCNAGNCNNGCPCNGGPPVMNGTMPIQGMPARNMMPMPATQMPGGSGYDDSTSENPVLPTPESDQDTKSPAPAESTTVLPAPQDISLPENSALEKSQKPAAKNKPATETNPATETKSAAQPPIPPQPAAPTAPETPSPKPTQTPPVTPVPAPAPNSDSFYPGTLPGGVYQAPATGSAQYPAYTVPRSYSPARQPVFVRNASRPNNPQPLHSQPAPPARDNTLIGPVGYDLQQ